MGEHYEFTDVWTIPAGIDMAWRMVDDVAGWPTWWPDYRFAEVVSTIKHGPGTQWHVRVKSDLPYTLDFNFSVLTHEPPRYVHSGRGLLRGRDRLAARVSFRRPDPDDAP
jgi:uncharacterized protein YndB with AHSA1/START domain